MSSPEDETPDETFDAYRRASGAEAGRPSAATRAAILAEARAAAAARAAATPPKPAANSPWFAWRIAASLLVVGVAVLLWRQLPRGAPTVLEPPRAPVVLNETVRTESAKEEPQAAAPRSDVADKPATPLAVASAVAPAQPAPPPPVIVDLNAKQAVPESQAVAVTSDRRAADGFVRRRSESRTDFDALLRRDFPALGRGAPPPVGVWLLLDAGGRTLRSGMLDTGQTLGSVLTSLQRDLPDRKLQPFETGIVRLEGGATVLVGVARAN